LAPVSLTSEEGVDARTSACETQEIRDLPTSRATTSSSFPEAADAVAQSPWQAPWNPWIGSAGDAQQQHQRTLSPAADPRLKFGVNPMIGFVRNHLSATNGSAAITSLRLTPLQIPQGFSVLSPAESPGRPSNTPPPCGGQDTTKEKDDVAVDPPTLSAVDSCLDADFEDLRGSSNVRGDDLDVDDPAGPSSPDEETEDNFNDSVRMGKAQHLLISSLLI
jgi:hypothetical protein